MEKVNKLQVSDMTNMQKDEYQLNKVLSSLEDMVQLFEILVDRVGDAGDINEYKSYKKAKEILNSDFPKHD